MKILVAGDSYIYGQGCSDRDHNWGNPREIGPSNYCWPSLLQQHYPTLDVENYGFPGTDNVNIAKQVHQHLQQDIKLIVFCSTFISRAPARYPGAEDDFTITISPHWVTGLSEHGFDDSVTKYYKHLYNDLLGLDLLTNSLMSAYGAAKLIGADFLWTRPIRHQPYLDNQTINRLGDCEFKSTSDIEYTADELAYCAHPNNDGQARYFNEIITPLIDNFLQEHNEH